MTENGESLVATSGYEFHPTDPKLAKVLVTLVGELLEAGREGLGEEGECVAAALSIAKTLELGARSVIFEPEYLEQAVTDD